MAVTMFVFVKRRILKNIRRGFTGYGSDSTLTGFRLKIIVNTKKRVCPGTLVPKDSLFCMSKTISRVLSRMVICLGLPLPAGSSGLPESRRAALCFLLALLRMGFTCAPAVTGRAVVSYTALPTLPLI